MLLPVFKPYIRRIDMDSVLSCLISDKIGPGEIGKELISEINTYLSSEEGFLFRDYYRAISVALELLDLKSGSRVIISPLSPGVYIDVFRDRGIIPLFTDVEPDTAVMDKSGIDLHLENNADAIILHSPLGSVADLDYFSSLGIPLIEDISENFGSLYKDGRSGTFGDVALFSMESDKILTCGGGSGIFVKGKSHGERIKFICKKYGDEIFLPDINAALALTQYRNIEDMLFKRDELAKIFQAALNKTEHRSLKTADGSKRVHFSFPILLNSRMKEVKAYIMKKNIEPRKAFVRTALEIYESPDQSFPVASGLILRSLLLPLYPSLGKKNAEIISKVISTLP